MQKRLVALFVAVLLSLMLSAPAFASATPSDADQLVFSTPSDADMFEAALDDAELTDVSDAYLPDSVNQYSGMAALSAESVPAALSDDDDVVPWARVVNFSGTYLRSVRGTYKETSNGYKYFQWPNLTGDEYYDYVYYRVESLPSPGTYGVKYSFSEGNIGIETVSSLIGLRSTQTNVSDEDSYVKGTLTSSGASYTVTGNVQIGYKTGVVYLYLRIMNSQSLDIMCPVQNPYIFTFSAQEGSTAVAPDVSGGSGTAQEAIADSSAQISQNTASMSDTLKEIVQTISNQLAALWDQMYNLMHVPQLANDDKNTNLILNKLNEDLNVEIQNQNDNTETIINGYDNSSAGAANDKLQGAVSEYDSAEGAVFDQVKDGLSGYSFEDFSSMDSSVLAAVRFTGSYLQDLFVSIGIFNSPITVALTLTVAMMLVGYYRVVKGG